MNINWWQIAFGEEEIESLTNAINSRQIAQGALTEAFENALAEFCGAKFAICTPNGSQALMLAYLGADLKAGDEIITTNRTFIATAHAAALLGAKVRAIDVNARQFINIESALSAINSRTKIIAPVYMNGVYCDISELLKEAKKRGIDIIEDACQALGSKTPQGVQLGTLGRFGCFSLGLAKILSTGQGGFVLAHSKEDADKLRKIRNQGVFDVRKERDFSTKAFNFKFTDLLAAVGLAQLNKIESKIKRVREVYSTYKAELADILWDFDGLLDNYKTNSIKDSIYFEKLSQMPKNKCTLLESKIECGEVPMRTLILSPRVGELKEFLSAKKIGSSFESVSLNTCPHLEISGEFHNSDFFHNGLLVLPSGPDQELCAVKTAANAVKEFFLNH